jgi:phosphatidylinositol phospholipase C delta
MNPFVKTKRHRDEDDAGDNMDINAVAGGGHSARVIDAKKSSLRVSNALKSFIVKENLLSEEHVGFDSEEHTPALVALLTKSHINVPSSVTDPSFTLPDYFVSSSHNTYLMAHQLYGSSNVDAYKTALRAGSRCVEIDAWDDDNNKDEPKVTHGFTLVSHIPFRTVCEAIRDIVDEEAVEAEKTGGPPAPPILISLENHCNAHGQRRLVEILNEVLDHRLLKAPVEKGSDGADYDPAQHIRLRDLQSKVAVIVEHHLQDEAADNSSSSESSDSSDSSDDEEHKARDEYKKKKKSSGSTVIIPELGALGVYAQSVKPGNNSWFDPGELINGPHHHLINVSESGLRQHLPAGNAKIATHNSKHLMRVYPKGTRIASNNLKPVPFWGVGAQICAMNWQRFDASMQINEALFSGTSGYVLKPASLREGGSGLATTGRKKKLRLHVAGATDVPNPAKDKDDANELRPYVTCVLVHPDDHKNEPPKRKTSPYKQRKLNFLHRGDNPPPTEPVWDEVLEWEYDDSELVFLRMLVKNDKSFAKNPILGVAALRVMYLVPGWSFVEMLDLKGRETPCSVLVKVEVEDA